MKRSSLLGFVVAIVVGTTALVAPAQRVQGDARASWWPDTVGNAIVDEWYADLPWHQKLGTYAGNQIDQPIVMPYALVDHALCDKKGWTKGTCMIETGVTNVLAMHRRDTLYDSSAPKIKADLVCTPANPPERPQKCIEVMLKVSNWYTKSSGESVTNAQRLFGSGVPVGNPGIFTGYTLSDGTTYAPQMPWYMSHYCDGMWAPNSDFNDPVCYGDYLSTFNSGFNEWGKGIESWPVNVPWSVFPAQPDPNLPGKWSHICKQGLPECNIALSGFNLKPLPSDFSKVQYYDNNNNLLQWFNNAVENFAADQGKDNERHFPWRPKPKTSQDPDPKVAWQGFYAQSAQNPFLGTFTDASPDNKIVNCNAGLTAPVPAGCGPDAGNTGTMRRADPSLYPRQCELGDVVKGDASRLRNCSINYELHHNGWADQWPAGWLPPTARNAIFTNQYGRTSFLFAGVPGMQMPVSFAKVAGHPKNYSTYDQVYNTSIFSMYIPMVNEANTVRQMGGRAYNDDFYHTLLMSNHNESDPDTFVEGIRGKTLWHNEYRTNVMYISQGEGSGKFPTEMFDAAFPVPAEAPATPMMPFHNNTCDGCHVRNGSGIPVNTAGKLEKSNKSVAEFMQTDQKYLPLSPSDYTFTGVIRPMKLVLFDLKRAASRLDASTPLLAPRAAPTSETYYSNAVMNYYGDSFHVTPWGDQTYQWQYADASAESVVAVPTSGVRRNPQTQVAYTPQQVTVGWFVTNAPCQLKPKPRNAPVGIWPTDCKKDLDGVAIQQAIATQAVGYMLLNGKRLGNSSAIEAMPDTRIQAFRADQVAGTNGAGRLGESMAGELIWTAGSRDDVLSPCIDTNNHSDCFIGRFGWVGDRASLEDQVANAAFVEMNMTSSAGFDRFYPDGKARSPIRYAAPNCGPANDACTGKKGNADLSEKDIGRMADYARWVGNPTRSEFVVTLPDVASGEQVFRSLQCNTCHVIDKVSLDPLINPKNNALDTMLPAVYRERLKKRAGNNFLSYLGTDLLLHDMGYLSQVGVAPKGVSIRDKDGLVLAQYVNFVQKIRTPALKGIRFNRFVTDAFKNTQGGYNPQAVNPPACDFLMHDGRACDAVEAAFLHDGPAIKKLDTINKLNNLSADQVLQLRAFLYSL